MVSTNRAWILDSCPSACYDYTETVTGINEFLKACVGKKYLQLEVGHLEVIILYFYKS